MSAVKQEETAKKGIQEIKPSQLRDTAFVRQNLTVAAKAGQTLEDLLEPKVWASIADKIKPWDRIEVIEEAGAYVAELFVVSTSRQWVRVVPLMYKDLSDGGESGIVEDNSDHEVAWRGPHAKWCVVRNSDNSVVSERNESKEAALKQKAEYERALSR
jgi:hypothetical protein